MYKIINSTFSSVLKVHEMYLTCNTVVNKLVVVFMKFKNKCYTDHLRETRVSLTLPKFFDTTLVQVLCIRTSTRASKFSQNK